MLELACWSMESVNVDESLLFPSPDLPLLNFEKSMQNKQLNKPINIERRYSVVMDGYSLLANVGKPSLLHCSQVRFSVFANW
jgi:hypothetical protein